MLIATNFNLRDYDSPDIISGSLNFSLTLSHAIDGDTEGIMVTSTGDVVMTEQGSTEEFTREYTLSNGTSYSQYEEV